MPSSFFFDAASDDELEQLDHDGVSSGEEDIEENEIEDHKVQAESGEDEEEDDDDDEEDEEEEEEEKRKKDADAQSPWDFASYSSSVGEEHARRHTTSIDEKISKALQYRSVPISVEEDEEEEEGNVSDAEPDKQEEYISEDDDAADLKGEDVAKPFFSTVEGVSFQADSFLELNLSRPLLRACETLGYKKPTPIQVQFLLNESFRFIY